MNARLYVTFPPGDADLVRVDQAHCIHGYRVFDDHRVNGSPNIAAGDSAYIYDIVCGRYFDAVGGMWCTNIGLGYKGVVRTVAEQTHLLAYSNPFYDMASLRAIELCRKLAEPTPDDLDHVFLTIGGSIAADAATRFMHYYQNCRSKHAKRRVTTRINACHDSAFLGASLGGKSADRPVGFDFLDKRIHHFACPHYYRVPEGVGEAEFLDDLAEGFERKILEPGADRVRVFIPEPVSGSGGVIIPPAGYHRRMWELCQRYDVLYISDRVVTSLGRLGHFFISRAMFDVQSDIVLTIKGLISGYQSLGAYIFSRRIWEVITEPNKGHCLSHGFTCLGHPVACTTTLKSIEIIGYEGLLAHASEVDRYSEERPQSLRGLPIVDDVRGMRPMAYVELVADEASKALFPKSLNIGEWVHLWAQKRSLLVRPIAHLNVMSPPLILICEQADTVVRVLREGTEETVEDLVRAGHR